METKKIAIACFVGGVLCSSVALIFSPGYWWLGLLAGFAGGHLSYEFREVLKAIPVAFRSAGSQCSTVCGFLRRIWGEARTSINSKCPFLHLTMLLNLPIMCFIFFYLSSYVVAESDVEGLSFRRVVFYGIWLFLIITAYGYGGVYFVLCLLADIGAKKWEKCYWLPLAFESSEDKEKTLTKLKAKGFSEKPLTYTNVCRWVAEGLGITVRFFVWTFWKELVVGTWKVLFFIGLFFWCLFRIIHSEKRVLCGIDGTLGGMISYVWLISPSALFAEQVLLVVFGGLLGAAFGVVNWEVVSIRVLKVATKGA